MNTMKLSSIVLTCLVILLSVVENSTSYSALDNFLQCLPTQIDSKTLSSNPISSAIYTPDNSSFSSILLNRTANRRHTTPTTPKPLAIITAKHPSHVQATIKCAKSHGLQVRTRSGGHDYEGLSYISHVPFVVIDMFNLHSIEIDLPSETAWVEAGATLGEIYYSIANKSNIHAFPAGVCVTLGAGGHISGGGYGNLMRKYGLSVDNVVDANLIDVNGRILDRKSMGEDVFWAIRGGGGASFGVVLSWKIKLVSVPPKVTVFNVNKTLEQGVTDLVHKWQFVATKLDKDLFIRVMPEVINATQDGSKKTVLVSFIGEFLGEIDRLIPLVSKSFPELNLTTKECIEMPWVNSTLWWANYPAESLETLLSKLSPPEIFMKAKSDYVKTPIPKIELESIWKMMIENEIQWMQWNPYGGRMGEISSSETPFPHRAGNLFLIQYMSIWGKEGDEEMNQYMELSRKFHEFMGKYVSKSPREAFQNYRDVDIGANQSNETIVAVAESYGKMYFKENFERLVRVKTMVDPENFFKHEQSIPPQTRH